MDEKVAQELKLAFSLDLYETVKAARKNRDEHVFRHTMAEEGGQMVFVGMFPKKDLMEMPNMTEEFVSRLQTFNLLGVVTDGKSGLDMFYLGGMNKPYTTLNNGRELARNLLSLYPDLKRLFTSGYTANVIAHHGVLDEGVQFIQKPFSIKELADKVRKALDDD